MMVVLIAIFGWLVWGRYVMNNTPTRVEQVSLLLIVWITFLGAAIGVRHSRHLSIDFVRDTLPAAIRLPCTFGNHLAIIFPGCIRIEQALKSIWPFYRAILVALLLVSYVPALSMFLPSLL